MREPFVAIIRFSAASGELWTQLAAAMETEFRRFAPGDVVGVPNAAAVVLAGGGAEREAIAWLEGRTAPPGVPIFVVGADGGRRIAVEAVREGATDYFALPEDGELLHNAIMSAVERSGEARRRGADTSDPREAFRAMAGVDPAFTATLDRALQVAHYTRASALILGEEGAGKEMLARAIHMAGTRRAAPFVPVNCAAIPEHLFEAELFGHEAHGREPGPRLGLLEVAQGGTLYLEEIGALPAEMQVKLERVLDEGEACRVGGTRVRPVDLRVIAASREDLEAMVRRGAFRRELYLRLRVVTLFIPPLRSRVADIIRVAERLVVSLARLHELPAPEISPEVRRALEEHSWPGNVRELKHALERALLLSTSGQLNVAELFPHVSTRITPAGGIPFPAELDHITNAAACAMMEMCGGNLSEAARRLNISRSRLRRLLKATPTGEFARAAS